MRLYLVRHCESENNKNGIIQGQLDSGVTLNGLTQARLVGQRLRSDHFDAIYSSDLARTAITAAEIARHHPTVPFYFTPDLRERDLGELQGKSKLELGIDEAAGITAYETRTGESNNQLVQRVRRVLGSTLERHEQDTVLYVTHGGVIKASEAILQNKDIHTIPKLDNASVTIYDISKDWSASLVLRNCSTHLRDPEQQPL